MKLFSKQRGSSVLGIAIDGNRLEAVVVRRSGGSLQVRQSVSAAMALAPLTGDPELVGREIRNHLETAGIRENRCVVCLPLTWVLTLQTKLPDISGADLDSYLQIEAERGFSSGYESLFITRSMFKAPNGEKFVTLLAVPRANLDMLERALRAAKLKPRAFAMGISANQSPSQQPNSRVLTLALSSFGLELQVSGGGGIIALRSLDAAVESEGARRKVSADLVARELRITLGQLPGGFSDGPGPIKIFGEGDTMRQFVTEISPRLSALGLRVEPMDRPAAVSFDTAPKPEIAASPVLALASAYVLSSDVGPDFLPPKVAPWRQFVSTKLSTQKLAYAGGAAAVILLILGGLFGWQQVRLYTLNRDWDKIKDQVTQLETDDASIQKYRPWFGQNHMALQIMARLTDAFPDYGYVSVKSLEVQNLSSISVRGIATTMPYFNQVRETLGKIPGVREVHADTVGQPPQISFNLTYTWIPRPEEPPPAVATNAPAVATTAPAVATTTPAVAPATTEGAAHGN
jgi:hypothetical protein